LDVGKLHGLGWKHGVELKAGVESTYAWFLGNQVRLRK
jgi:GDP-L-fucose synthase